MVSSWSIQHRESPEEPIVASPCDHTRHGFRFNPPKPEQKTDILCLKCGEVIGYAVRRDGVLQIALHEDRPTAKMRERINDDLLLA